MVDRSLPISRAASSSAQQDQESDLGDTLSMSQISQKLASKDPAWFRQTQDRGAGSPAYLQTRTEAILPSENISTRRALHGLSREMTPEVSRDEAFKGKENQAVVESTETEGLRNHVSDLAKPLHGSSPDNTTSGIGGESAETSFVSETNFHANRTAYERPGSPTKGMGGFVQSAMLKRSDSVNKRWSAQTTPVLSRQNSKLGNRGNSTSHTSSGSINKLGEVSRDGSQERASRPGSAHGQTSGKPQSPTRSNHQRKQQSIADATGDEQSPPSPSKRWSPLKSSWLESALNKPDTTTSSPSLSAGQPAWMTELARAKKNRADQDVTEKSTSRSPDDVPSSISKISEADRGTTAPQVSSEITSATKPELRPNLMSNLGVAGIDKPVLPPKPAFNPRQETLDASPVIKAKPITPPKKDFRSQLKSREVPDDKPSKPELEFKNVFGNLKRTKTVNYIAPDELKDNILRGKAGLAVTDGPQKTQRRDELKEDLVRQKEAIKAKAPHPSNAPGPRKPSASIVPEAIAKKRALGRNDSIGNVMSSSSKAPVEKGKQISVVDTKPVDIKASSSVPSQQETTSSKNRFADRFNPALASILARGPPAVRSPEDSPSRTLTATPVMQSRGDQAEAESSAQLQHMTKTRARGPKRRLPKGAPSTVGTSPTMESSTVSSTATTAIRQNSSKDVAHGTMTTADAIAEPRQKNALRRPEISTKPRKLSGSPLTDTWRAQDVFKTSKIGVGSPNVSVASSALPSKPFQPSSVRSPTSESSTILGSSPKTEAGPSASDELGDSNRISVGATSGLWGRSSDRFPQSSLKSSTRTFPLEKKAESLRLSDENAPKTPEDSNIKVNGSSFTLEEKEFSKLNAPPRQSVKPLNAAFGKPSTILSPQRGTPRPLDLETGSDRTLSDRAASESMRKPQADTPQTSLAVKLLQEFFDEAPVAPDSLELDTNAILTSGLEKSGRIKTLITRVCELSGSGKLQPLSGEDEHILFSDKVYVCTHGFEDDAGLRSTEVFLWAGSAVSDAEVDDSQLFANRIAKENGCTLTILRQGKETGSFFQALGGIVVTRSHGSKSTTDRFMLCGRRHLGHLVFDEVPCSPSSLCSGFPYILVSGSRDVHIWKGAGCSAEELGGARLISMEICPSAQVTEMDEGKELPDFLTALSSDSQNIPRSASHWKLKPRHQDYGARLFLVEWDDRPSSNIKPATANGLWGLVRRQSRPTQLQIEEIKPFTQGDLAGENIYVLDSFFEIYV